MKSYRNLIVSVIFLLAGCVTPQDVLMSKKEALSAPLSITLQGKVYQQAFTHSDIKQSLWEYTTDGEKVENWQWTRLVTITQSNVKVPLLKWTEALVQTLESTQPKPHYGIEVKGNLVEVRIIYQPKPNTPKMETYESNVWLTRQACGGIVSINFARQYTTDDKETQTEKLKSIKEYNDADMQALKALNWQPQCR